MLKLSRHRFENLCNWDGEDTSKERDEGEELSGQRFEGLVN